MPALNQQRLRVIAIICCAMSLALASRIRAETPARKPNIIVVFTDDQGFADLSCQGVLKDVKTPHIDRLAGDGVRMTSGYCTAPQCTPSRAGLLTGRYQQRFGTDHFAPHVPLEATEKYLARFPGKMPERRRHALAMISAMDDGVGRIRETLQKHGLEKDTLIFFISDNGAPLKTGMPDSKPITENGWDGSRNDPWKGEKGMLTEGGIRVPYIVTWPGQVPAGKVYSNSVSTLDVAATALAIAGQKPVAELDGVDLIPYLTGATTGEPHANLYWRFWNQSAIRQGRWKYLQVGGAKRYLFDLSSPKHESENLIEQQPEIAKRMAADLVKWAAGLKTPGIHGGKLNPQEEQFYRHYCDAKE